MVPRCRPSTGWPSSATTCRASAASPRSPPTCARPSRPNTADTTCIALPVNDTEEGYAYPPRVRFELTEKDIDSYRRAADFLNINNVDLVCLQFEYGIFGGRAGSHILALLARTAHAHRHDPAHHPARARSRSAPGAGRSRGPVRPAGRHERARRGIPAGDLSRVAGEDRPDPARHPRCALRRSEFPQGPVRRRRQDRPAQLRPALGQQGHRERHRRAAGDRRTLPERRLHHPRRDPSARDAARRRNVSVVAAMAGAGKRRGRQRDLLQPLCQPGRTHRVHRRGGHLHHALSQRGSRSSPARWPTRWARARP